MYFRVSFWSSPPGMETSWNTLVHSYSVLLQISLGPVFLPTTLLYAFLKIPCFIFLHCCSPIILSPYQFSSVHSLSRVQLFATPWTPARQASLSITNSWNPPKLMSFESVMPSNHLILCRPFLLLPSIFPSIRVFSNESVLPIRWPKYESFSFNISPSNEYSGLISFRMDWLDLLWL